MNRLFTIWHKYKTLLVIILPAFIFHMFISWPSGSTYCFENSCGFFFWGAHGHDAIWHLAVSEVSFTRLPFISPIFAGSTLSGYNYGIDIFIFLVSLVGLSVPFIYFKVLPVIWFIGITWVSIVFARRIHTSPLFIGSLLFFVYFGSSFTYLFTLYHNHTIWNSAGLLAMQAGQSLINIQFAYSLIVVVGVLLVLQTNIFSLRSTIIAAILVSIAVALKFYAGIIVCTLVASAYFLQLLQTKKFGYFIRSGLIIVLFFAITIVLLYQPQNTLDDPVLSWRPFSMVHPLIEERHLFYLPDLVNARYYLESVGSFSPRWVIIIGVSTVLYIVFNFGTRIIGLAAGLRSVRHRSWNTVDGAIVITILIAAFLPVFFVQRGEWWNTIQFLYYALFLANIYAAEVLFRLLSSKKTLFFLCGIGVVAFTLPANIDILRVFTVFPAPSYLPEQEYKALKVLREQPAGVVLASPFNPSQRRQYPRPVPLRYYDDTSYVSAFSGKQTYITNTTQLRLTGIDYASREQRLHRNDCAVLNEIDYIYEATGTAFIERFDACIFSAENIYESKDAKIIKILKTKNTQPVQ